MQRVDESKILLNLDHSAFNTKREQMCNAIREDVLTYQALPVNSPVRAAIPGRLAAMLAPDAAFSTAALDLYVQLHRHLDWVEVILNQP